MTFLDYLGNAVVICCFVGFVIFVLGAAFDDGTGSGCWARGIGCGIAILGIIILTVADWLLRG